jgi:hypothetical protein
MAYTQPGVIVRPQIEEAAVQIQSADQEAALIGEAYEVLVEQKAVAAYSPATGAGAQTFAWPGKKLTSIVDLAGVRSDTAEPDALLRERAEFPFIVELQDPTTLVKVELDMETDISAVSQSGFQIAESVAGATAKLTTTEATSSEKGKIRFADGGVIGAGTKIGDVVRVVLDNGGSPVTAMGTVTALNDVEITYVTDSPAVADDPVLSAVDGDAVTTTGKINTAAAGLLAAVEAGDRVVLWPEAYEVDDGNAVTAGSVTSASLALSAADVGRKVTLGSAKPADGAVSGSNGATTATNQLSGTGITPSMVGRVIKINGGSISLPATYRRIVTAASGQCTYSGTPIANATALNFLVYAPMVRNITSVSGAGQFGYDGASIADALQVTIPVILHTRVARDVTAVEDDDTFSYSGQALVSGTGFLVGVPFAVYPASVSVEVYPNYSVLVTYRALDVTLNRVRRVANTEDIAALGGSGEFSGLLFAAERTIGAMGTDDRTLIIVGTNPWQHQTTPTGFSDDRDDVAAYLAAQRMIGEEISAYFLVPLSFNATVRDNMVSHVNAKSDPEERLERTTQLAYELPMGSVQSTTGRIEPGLDGGNKKILDADQDFISLGGIQPGDSVVVTSPAAYKGTYLAGFDTVDGELELQGTNWAIAPTMTVANGDFSVAGRVSTATANAWKDAKVGDWIKVGSQYRRVTSRISAQILAYSGAPLTGTGVSVSIVPSTVISYYARPLSTTEQAQRLFDIGKARSNKRVINVWPDRVIMNIGTDAAGAPVKKSMPSYIAAAMLAGQMSVLPIQNSLTKHPLPGIVGLEHSNRYFDTTELNKIAEGGWTILVQPVEGGTVLTRHLKSTATLLTKEIEFSFTKNVDNQAKVLRDTLDPFLNDENGRKNISDELLNSMMLPAQAVFDFFAAKGQLVSLDGVRPYTLMSIKRHPTLIDRIVLRARGNEPLPANNLEIEFFI